MGSGKIHKVNVGLTLIFVFLIIACKKNGTTDNQSTNEDFRRILILGNSITYYPADASLGWQGNWGMAASAKEKDYVHILISRFQNQNKESKVKFINFSAFEYQYDTYDLNRIDSLKKFNPDLLILRIGENVQIDSIKEKNFEGYYTSLIHFFQSDNPNLKVICVSNFWKNPTVENIISDCVKKENVCYVPLSSLDQKQYTAWGLFSNSAVASHPNDKGMLAIADLIWKKVNEISEN